MSEKMRKDATAEMTSEVGLWRGQLFSQEPKGMAFLAGRVACTEVLWLEDSPEDSTKGEGPVTGARNPWGREEDGPGRVRLCSLGFVLVGSGVGDRQPLEALNQGHGPREQHLTKLCCAEKKSAHRKPRARTRGIAP